MEATLIEKLDRSRHKLVLWLTVGWILSWMGFMFKEVSRNYILLTFILSIGLLGWILFTINLFRFVRLGKQVNADKKLKEALNNELYELYSYKSAFWGFWTVMACLAVFIVIALFYQISALWACEFTLFLGVSSSLIARLIYQRD